MKNIDLHDPRLTDYALDEMEPALKAEFERLLRDDPGAQKAVEEIRAAARDLQAALEAEPGPALAEETARPAARAAIVAGPDPSKLDGGKIGRRPAGGRGAGRAQLITFPQFYFVAAGLAAACFAVVFVAWERGERAEEARGKLAVRHEAREREESTLMRGAPPAPTGIALVPADYGSQDEQFFATAEAARSTFPLKVGTASFEEVRESLRQGRKPGRAQVHVAELVNAFAYAWPATGEGFATVLEEAEAPWAAGHRLVRVGLKARAAAHDARVVVEFDPAAVRAWRLIGFERDAGMVGIRGARESGESLAAGQAITALYEIVPAGPVKPAQRMLRLTLNYRDADGGAKHTLDETLRSSGTRFADASEDFKFAAAVSAFGLILRDSPHRGSATLGGVLAWAGRAPRGERDEFAAMVREAQGVMGE
ncbi:MAG: von Willebrand factor type A domain-containing protein [Opitutae bacterium]|nr:von Willebrand factor type A domain-containing protein [Opitutae bacterium]